MNEIKCIYCDSIQNPTKDHVPPQSIFPNPKPSNLITVDSCLKCNKSFEKDDEYFKTLLFLRDDVMEHKLNPEQKAKVHKMFQRKKSHPFMKSIADRSEMKNFYTKAGIYLGQKMAINPVGDRIINFMKRITTGICYHETGIRLPQDNRFAIFDAPNLNSQPAEVQLFIFPILKDLVFNKPRVVIGENVFTYSYHQLEDNKESFIGFFTFYEYVQYMTISNPMLVNKKAVN